MITRTILATKASVLTVDTISMTASTMEFTIGGEWTDNNKLLKALKKTYETDTLVLSSVVKAEKTEKLYGMTEELFMANAVELDAETRKPVGTSEPAEPTAEPAPEPRKPIGTSEPAEPTAEPAPEPRKPIGTLEPAEPTVEPTAEPQNGMAITAPVTVTQVKAEATKIEK